MSVRVPPAAIAGLLLLACAGQPRRTASPARTALRPITLQCVPARLPASFSKDFGSDLGRAQPLFEQTRDIVLSTASLLLNTGSFARGRYPVARESRPPRAGSRRECKELRAAGGGAPPARLTLDESAPGPLLVTALLAYEYVAARIEGQQLTPQVELHVVVLVVGQDGTVERTISTFSATDYARIGMGFSERNPQEVALSLAELLLKNLARELDGQRAPP